MLAPPLYVERLKIAYNSVNSAVEQLSTSSLIPADPAWLEQHSAKCLFQPLDSAIPVGTTGVAGNSGGRPSPPPVVRCIASVCFETITQIDLKISRSTHPNILYIGTLASAPTHFRSPFEHITSSNMFVILRNVWVICMSFRRSLFESAIFFNGVDKF